MNDFKFLNESQEQARQIGFSQFGKLTIDLVELRAWVEDAEGNRNTKVLNETEWYNAKVSERFSKVKMSIDVQEFNPKLDWVYERQVDMQRGKKSDWAKIVQPSIDKVFGKGKTLEQINGLYVEARDVPQIRDQEYNTIEFVRVFKNKDEAFAAYNEKVGGGSTTSASASAPAVTSDIPPMYTEANWPEMVAAFKKEQAAGKSPKDISDAYGIDMPYIVKALAS